MNEKFYVFNDVNGSFEFQTKTHAIEFCREEDEIIIKVSDDTHSFVHEPQYVSMRISAEDWPEFVKRINEIKISKSKAAT